MDTEVMMTPSAPVDFDFDSACTTPYISATSSPQRFGTSFFSAPTSPTRISALISVENKTILDDEEGYDFAFDSGGQSERGSISAADELFDGGKIMPLKAPFESPRPRKQRLKGTLPPRNKKKATEHCRTENVQLNDRRGRERSNQNNSASSSSRNKSTRSLSPMRISDLLLFENSDEESTESNSVAADDCSDSSSSSSSVSSMISLWCKNWNLKDLLLFRSASESRTSSSTEELKKYDLVKKVRQEGIVKNSSSKLAGNVKKRGQISAHELHYRMKREMLKEMKKKTFLPYKQSLMGCSGFDDTIATCTTRRQ